MVSEESAVRDRERKPQLYAAAGIPYFWRIENADGSPVAYTFELEPATGAYVAIGICHDRIKAAVPFPVDIDITPIAGRP